MASAKQNKKNAVRKFRTAFFFIFFCFFVLLGEADFAVQQMALSILSANILTDSPIGYPSRTKAFMMP